MGCCCNNSGNRNDNVCRSPMVVQLNRVFNGARITSQVTDERVTLSNFSSSFTPPLTYISAEGEGIATILTQSITPLNDGRSRVAITYSVPITVVMRDAAGIIVSAAASLQTSFDIIIRLPVRTFSFEVAYSFLSRIGTVSGTDAFITGCLLTVLKVLVKCEMILCPCGCPEYPDAEFTEEFTCNVVFNRDI